MQIQPFPTRNSLSRTISMVFAWSRRIPLLRTIFLAHPLIPSDVWARSKLLTDHCNIKLEARLLLPEITTEITLIPMLKLCSSDPFYLSIPEKVYVYRVPPEMPHENGWTGYAGAKLEELWSFIGNHDLVYRGIPDPVAFESDLREAYRYSRRGVSQFGDGYYYTKRYDIACLSAGTGGVVTVHRFLAHKVEERDLVVRELRFADWEEVVQWNIGRPDSGLRGLNKVDIEADFVVGSLVEDVWDVWCGGKPVETGVWLGCARSAGAREVMMERLEAVIFLDLQPGEMKRE
jgi:hypothetical protein